MGEQSEPRQILYSLNIIKMSKETQEIEINDEDFFFS